MKEWSVPRPFLGTRSERGSNAMVPASGPARIRLLVATLCVLATGGVLMGWMIARTDRAMRTELQGTTHMVAQAINRERLKTFTGTAADLDNTSYQRLKEQLSAIRASQSQCRFIYLLGRKMDGSIFFFVDSEPTHSKDYSPPGQLFVEAPEGIRLAFTNHTAATLGPVKDRWGTWITALEPILHTPAASGGLAAPEDAQAMVQKAVAYYRQHGRERLLEAVNNPQGDFYKGELYTFVYDQNMTMRAHPAKPELVGQNLLDKKDWPGGKLFRQEIQSVAQSQGKGWVDYEYENPARGMIESKTTYLERADDLIVCAGAYKGTGTMIGALGMDIDARAWNGRLLRAALPAGLCTLVLVGLLWLGWVLSAQRTRGAGLQRWWLRWLEPVLVAAAGLSLTFFWAWTAHTTEDRDHTQAFAQLMASRTERMAEHLRSIRDTELAALAAFYENSETVSSEEFRAFTTHLLGNPVVSAWEWLPAVSEADRTRFEAQTRAEGLTGFAIWQRNSQRLRVPATARPVHYPVTQVAPPSNNSLVGYDPGSTALALAALEEAARTGLTTASEAIDRVHGTGTQKWMAIHRPVFAKDGPGPAPKRLRGFVVAVLQLEALLKTEATDTEGFLELVLLRKDAAPERLATSWRSDSPPVTRQLTVMHPVLVFGKAFGITAQAGRAFLQIHPKRAGGLALLIGLGLTTALSTIVALIMRKHQELEHLVEQRTHSLAESEANFRTFFATMTDMIMVGSPEGALLFSNAAVTQTLGYSPDELATMHILDLHPAGLRREASDIFAAMFRGERESCPLPLARKDGELIPVETRIWFGQWDGADCIFGISKNLTAEQEAQQRFERLFRNNPALMALASLPGREFMDVNEAFLKSLGYSRNDIIGRTTQELGLFVHPEQQAALAAKLQAEGRIVDFELQIRRRDGAILDGLFSGEVISTQGQRFFLTVMIDITEQKRTERELENTVAKANDLAFQALDSVRAKAEFLANMSHEIRTPLNGVLGMTELLADSNLSPEQAECVSAISRSGESLLALLNDILDFSKMEAGQMTLESVPFDLEQLVFEVVELFRGKVEESSVELLVAYDPTTPTHVRGDSGRLRQILNNLVSNAIKFTEAGHILVEVRATPLANDLFEFHFTVQDTGIGIPPEKQAHLFQPFTQADASTARRFGGTGLGLVLVKRIAEAMGGRVQLESRDGAGTTLSVDLPLAADNVPHGTPGGGAELAGKRILVIDDLAINRVLQTHQIEAHGGIAIPAASGAEALQTIVTALGQGTPFDAALVDLNMPQMDGLAFAERVRLDARFGRLALVVLTATKVRGDKAQFAAAGFDGFLLKPVRGSTLARTLVAALQRAEKSSGAELVTRHSVMKANKNISAHTRLPEGTRVLLVEDQEVNQVVARKFLETAGAQVEVAENGRVAVEKVASQPPDLVLMDCQMPEMDGFEATARIRAMEIGTGRHIPILAMTAHAMAGDRDRCLAAGMDDYLTKPITREALVRSVAGWLPSGAEQKLGMVLTERPMNLPPAPPELELDEALFHKLWEVFDRNGKEMEAVVIGPFVRRGEELLGALRLKAPTGDNEAIRSAAHALKGSSRTLALNALGRIAEHLEQECDTAPPEAVEAWIGEADQAFQAACRYLRTLSRN